MVNTKKWLVHFPFFYERAEISAFIIIYVCYDRAGDLVSCIFWKSQEWTHKIHYRVRPCSFFLLYSSFLFDPYCFSYFLFVERTQFCRRSSTTYPGLLPQFMVAGEGVSLFWVY